MRSTWLALAAALVWSGCAGYKLGPTNGLEAGSRTIQIATPVNQTYEPRVAQEVDHQLRKQVQRDGTFRLETRGEGDVIVTTTITKYHRIGETFQRRDTLTARDYRIQLFATVTAYDRVTGKNLVNREFVGRTTVRLGCHLPERRGDAAPETRPRIVL